MTKSTIIVGTGASNMRQITGLHDEKAKIIDPITAPEIVKGKHGRAWLCDIAFGHKLHGITAADDATVAHWIVEAPWAHPVWHSYTILMMHLRPMPHKGETIMHLPMATHELWVYALDPGIDRNTMLMTGICKGHWMSPLNFAAQFIEISDELAIDRVKATVQSICNGELSPDTDHKKSWEFLWGNNMIKKDYR